MVVAPPVVIWDSISGGNGFALSPEHYHNIRGLDQLSLCVVVGPLVTQIGTQSTLTPGLVRDTRVNVVWCLTLHSSEGANKAQDSLGQVSTNLSESVSMMFERELIRGPR